MAAADSTTTTARERWEWLSTTIALVVGVSYPLVVAGHAATPLMGWDVDVSTVPVGWFVIYSFGWVGVLTYVFGPATIQSAADIYGQVTAEAGE